MKNKFKIYTLGCKVNQYDSGALSEKLIASGFKLVKDNADLAIVNTCAVTQAAIRKGRQMINKAKRENPEAKIVLIGCWARVYEIDDVEKADLVITEKNIDKAVEKILNFKFLILKQFSNHNFQTLNLSNTQSQTLPTACLSGRHGRQVPNSRHVRFFLKIQDGCEQFCTYCVIPYARGPLSSRPAGEVIAEAKRLVKSGVREIVLCGIHLGLYGYEGKGKREKVKGENSLVILIKQLLKIKNLKRIRLSSIEVMEVGDDLIELMSKNNKICNHLHIPLQAGCDKILKLMNRPYLKLVFKNKIFKIRKKISNIAITTDVIVGFPGETEKDFEETCDFVKKIGFSQLHVFPFSAHEKTPAAKMKNQVSREVILKRAEKLRKIGEKLEKGFRKKFIGKKVEVLVEYIWKNGECRGKSDEYFEMKFKNCGYAVGDIVKVKVSK
jgi:threonylcarbamoyladenosine tRNA methylthiotransferase MtaB